MSGGARGGGAAIKPARDFASGEATSESTGLFTNPLTASPLSFTASLPKQKLSRAKSRQLRRLAEQSNRFLNRFKHMCNRMVEFKFKVFMWFVIETRNELK